MWQLTGLQDSYYFLFNCIELYFFLLSVRSISFYFSFLNRSSISFIIYLFIYLSYGECKLVLAYDNGNRIITLMSPTLIVNSFLYAKIKINFIRFSRFPRYYFLFITTKKEKKKNIICLTMFIYSLNSFIFITNKCYNGKGIDRDEWLILCFDNSSLFYLKKNIPVWCWKPFYYCILFDFEDTTNDILLHEKEA